MKYWNLKRNNQFAFEKVGPIPRSITNTFEKFRKELDPNGESEAIEEFRISRHQTITSVKYILLLFISPVLVNQASKFFVFGPCIDYLWNQEQPKIFLNSSQEERAFAELQRFEEKIHFEVLLNPSEDISYEIIEKRVQLKARELGEYYANESANAVKNILSDLVSILVFILLMITGQRQIAVVKSFLNEIIYGLSDTAKAFLIILFTDMFVGFHSPHGWEVIIEVILRHLGLPESRDFIFLFISTFPVILDTIFKYWIFRYLNQVSPSAVATYHNMNE
uniref:Potassium/proton antiporter CemA n=3 Tax=Pyropia TaxID=1094566 RepID=CEMA_PYRYE|nr:envelope membrane protein [Neopyropia yezoensis]Q1XDQ5.1 RecName: Full=Potassium/proton antiporter CemA; AltName: Full=Chloroplast envelope membrane protein A; Short=CemA [Neopyropia yezoensis]AIA21467.1 chloroplast envelope membrane protein [Neopyropia fucicola]AGH27557.1 envelope membrane protein [Neopyropia yezoensis]QFZ66893.1 envelope membrane protein [Neopyropia yezoensis]ULU28884.1 envelope membrane protein [Neopyropia yezoensis]WKD83388.1 chloroplast envelope membrane protein [Neop